MISTKKVLILSVIAMLALGVFALANTAAGYHQKAQWGPTCTGTTLTVNSVIGIEQGYVATATSYNASFCGAPCECICPDGTSVEARLLSGISRNLGTTLGTIKGILISELTVESNASPINVGFSVSQAVGTSNTLDTTYYLYYNNSTQVVVGSVIDPKNSNGNPTTDTYSIASGSLAVKLVGASRPYTGVFDIYINGSKTAWGKVVTPGDYFITTTFTISPQNTF